MSANDRQVGGVHYASKIQHWDYVVANNLGYFEGQITKYVTRWRGKNGIEDLLKAKHFLDKLIEVAEQEASLREEQEASLREEQEAAELDIIWVHRMDKDAG